MRTLFDTPAANQPAEADLVAPVPPVEAVLFDFANTIFRMIDLEEWFRRIDADLGRSLDDPAAAVAQLSAAYLRPDVVAAQIGRDSSADAHRRAMHAWFMAVDALRGHEDVAYDRMIADDSWIPYRDTEPTLRTLFDRGIPVGVVSDIAWDISAHVAHHGLADLIDAYALSHEVGREKPDPQIFLKACADLGVDPRRTLMVGDNPVRDGGASAVGIRTFILPAEHRVSERGLLQVLPLI
jgi:HAD superfamily hydrolase (TIGR01549 family)